ncbi:hypothetical protein HDIA_0971 [Hartmannibacter diazotrophicus]|uniref:Uncharacterized protein n=2 Tax=Hartmannibacter diazotrophicus TaxID=1482074 RepID=A0A2C9D2I1_9HYPH|nr:hypothetical protein HDIA_0971 [Hartmannibacter diazotrophicus]
MPVKKFWRWLQRGTARPAWHSLDPMNHPDVLRMSERELADLPMDPWSCPDVSLVGAGVSPRNIRSATSPGRCLAIATKKAAGA